jgi:hypothetical protein
MIGAELARGVPEVFIPGPEAAACDEAGGEELDIDPGESLAVQFPFGEEVEAFGGGDFRRCLKQGQVGEGFLAPPEGAAGEFAQDPWMNDDRALLQKGGKAGIGLMEVIDPDARVDQHVHARRREGAEAFGSLPPSRASRWAAARRTRFSSPRWISRVFSWMPVAARAFSTKASSRMSVVLMQINMHILYVLSKKF